MPSARRPVPFASLNDLQPHLVWIVWITAAVGLGTLVGVRIAGWGTVICAAALAAILSLIVGPAMGHRD